MADDEGAAVGKCRSCGAPFGDVAAERCEYCGATVDTGVAATRYAVHQAEALSKRAWRRSWVYVLALAGLSSLLAFFGQWRATTKARTAEQTARQAALAKLGGSPSAAPQRERLDLTTLLASLPQPDGKLALLFATSRAPEHPLVLLDAATAKVRWQNAPYGSYVRKSQVAHLGDRLFVVEGARLLALAVADGAVLWRASLVADYMDYTDGLRASGERVAVLLRDGTTQAFDAASGRTVWTRRQKPPPHRLPGAVDTLVELLRVEKRRGVDEQMAVVDLASGAVRHTLRPRCSTHSIIPANEPSSSSPLVFSPDGEELYLFYGINRFCVDRWDLRPGTLAWQLNRNSDFAPHATGGKLESLLSDQALFYPGRDGIYAVGRQRGDLRKVIADPDNRLSPVLTDGKLLVATAVPSWEHSDCDGAKNCSLWGVDIAQGTVRWRYALPGESKGGRHGTDGRFAGQLTPDGLTLALAGGEQLILEQIDRDTGVVRNHQVLKHDSPIRALDFQDGLVWLDARGFMGIDPTTGATRYRLQ